MNGRECAVCEAPLVRRPREEPAKWATRQCCSLKCSQALAVQRAIASTVRRRAERIEDVEWLVGTDHPERIAHRLGWRDAETMTRILYRWGRPDLARALTVAGVAA